MSRHSVRLTVILAVFALFALALASAAIAAKGGNKPPDPGGGGGGNKPPTESTNNLSFPVIAVDDFAISTVTESLTVPYTGDYPGVEAADILDLLPYAPWYAQKTIGNTWQADYALRSVGEVTVVDWSDSMEGVYPKVNNPFRLEVVLFNRIDDLVTTDYGVAATVDPNTGAEWAPMNKYRMGVLEYPSSKNELQGTHADIKDELGNIVVDNEMPSDWATVISSKPKLVVQYLGATEADIPADLEWAATQWMSATVALPIDKVSFAVELNVGGKYIFGASKKGWVPTQNGFYRITFYAPSDSEVDMTGAYTGDAAIGYAPSAGDAATGFVDATNNLAYIDVEVGGTSEPGGDEGGE